jgi:TatA/E family protein of Tat protein translocase
VFVLLFGARKLPDLGSSMAKTIRNFKSGLNDAKKDEEQPAEDVTVQAETREEAKVPPTTPPPA